VTVKKEPTLQKAPWNFIVAQTSQSFEQVLIAQKENEEEEKVTTPVAKEEIPHITVLEETKPLEFESTPIAASVTEPSDPQVYIEPFHEPPHVTEMPEPVTIEEEVIHAGETPIVA